MGTALRAFVHPTTLQNDKAGIETMMRVINAWRGRDHRDIRGQMDTALRRVPYAGCFLRQSLTKRRNTWSGAGVCRRLG